MIKKLSVIIVLLLTFPAFAQDKTIFEDDKGNEIASKEYSFYFVIKDYDLTKEKYDVQKYDEGGTLVATYAITDKDKYRNRTGTYTEYYPNGAVMAKTELSDLGVLESYTSYYSNGQKRLEGTYLPLAQEEFNQRFLITNFWEQE